ncbi:hypothetical protein SEA_PAELLA_234 [Arthrobacter phage Paella]|nr:hypothetical protein SEA_PAELLA_234 [Arthrobacter phage Paella]
MSKNWAEVFGRLEVFASSLLEETERESHIWDTHKEKSDDNAS